MFEHPPESAQDFHNSILIQSIAALKLNTFLDNFDADRFNIDGSDHSTQFNAGERAFFFDWFVRNSAPLFEAYSLLGDATSRRLYLHLMGFRLAGHFCVKLPVDFVGESGGLETFRSAASSRPSELPSSGMFGKLKHYDFEFEGHRYVVDCLGLEQYLFRRQYFFDRDGVVIRPEAGDFVIDGGACAGDTAAVFSNVVGADGMVFCFDPVADHLAILEHNVRQFPLANVRIMPYGLSDRTVAADPIVLHHYAPGFNGGNSTIPLRSIDQLVESGDIPRVNFIKLDVEGAELESLRGARRSIERFRPKLAISLYHKPNDIFELIQYVRRQFPFYSLHLDHYTIHVEETVLYCREKPG
jgi:FkbM family methyltransferase